MKLSPFFVFLLFAFLSGHAWTQAAKLEVFTGNTPAYYLDLLKPLNEIRDDDLLNERIVDQVEVYLTDSILPIKIQRHRVFGAAIIPLLGFKWKTINFRKEKYVGTNLGGIRIPGGDPYFTEYDVNFNIAPHLKRYIDLAFLGYSTQKEIGRAKKKKDYEAPPYTYPTEETDLRKYKLHCELTPPVNYRPMINEKFYPVIVPNNLVKHQNFQEDKPTLGMYGALVSDCNHTCHPEIHPYEWLWWLKTAEELDDTPLKRVWLAGLFREGSNRFPKWSPSPRSGEISIPFIFDAEQKVYRIKIEHLVFSKFSTEGFVTLSDIPENARDFNFRTMSMGFDMAELAGNTLEIETDSKLSSEGIQWWIGELGYDRDKKLVSGRLHIALSVEDIYNARITME